MSLTKPKNIYVIIPCAGVGQRFDKNIPKQYAKINNKTLLWHTLSAILKVERVTGVLIVANPQDLLINEYKELSDKIRIANVGADTRSGSVLNGLLDLANNVSADDWVLVHDAARCCITSDLINKLIDQVVDDLVGGILAIKAVDTIKQVDFNGADSLIIRTIDRNIVYMAQTPQMFRYGVLKDCLLNSDLSLITDESSAVEQQGYQVKVIDGNRSNIKVTYPDDMYLAEAILNKSTS